MRRIDRFGAAAVTLLAAFGAEAARATAASSEAVPGHALGRGPELLESRLTSVPRPYTGAVNKIRDISGAGLPWVITRGKAELREDGLLEVEVEGLVFDPADATVIERGLAGRNTVPEFKAIVSCLSRDDEATATTVNVETATVPATQGLATEGGGDAFIEEQLTLPSPCLAPIVFVTTSNGAWLAITGM